MDASAEALAVAQANAAALGVAGRAAHVSGDWRQPGWAERLGGPFDLVVSNPPYIEAGAIDGLMPEVARFEPRLALDGGPDGLAAYRNIATAAPALMVPGGRILVEGGEGQAPEISRIFCLRRTYRGSVFGRTSAASTAWSRPSIKRLASSGIETTFRLPLWRGFTRLGGTPTGNQPSEYLAATAPGKGRG